MRLKEYTSLPKSADVSFKMTQNDQNFVVSIFFRLQTTYIPIINPR